MRRPRSDWALRVLLVCTAAIAPLMVSTSPASAACAADPDALPIRQMITTGTTGSERFNVLFLGRVVRLRDLDGEAGGPTLARFWVKSVPVGSTPDHARVRFWMPPPNVSVSENLEFKLGRRFAVVAHRRSNGVFWSDGACGQTTQLSQRRMHRLIRLYHHT